MAEKTPHPANHLHHVRSAMTMAANDNRQQAA